MLLVCTFLLLAAAQGPLGAIVNAPPTEVVAGPPAPAPLEVPATPDPIVAEPVFDPAAVLPYFSDSDRKLAVEELQDGHGAAALKLLPARPADLPTRFIRAQALALSGDQAGAALEFEALADKYTVLSARCHCLAATAFEAKPGDAKDDLERAAAHWKACAFDPPHSRSGLVQSAKLLIKLDHREQALEVLKPLIATPGYGRADALNMTGQIYEALDQPVDAIRAYRTAYVEEPASAATDHAREALKDYARKLKVVVSSTEQSLDRIEKLLVAKQSNRALHEIDELHLKPVCTGDACKPLRCHAPNESAEKATDENPDEVVADSEPEAPPPDPDEVTLPVARKARPFTLAKAGDDEDPANLAPAMPVCAVPPPARPADELSCRAQLLRGLAESHTKGVRVRALASLRAVYAHCGDPDVRARAQFAAQDIAFRVADTDAFDMAIIGALQFPAKDFSDDALLAAAETARNKGDGKSERLALRFLVSKYKDSDQRAEALFRLFWSHRAEGRPDRGLDYLNTLSLEYENGPKGDGGDAERGRYWWGRTVATDAVKADRPRGIEVLARLAHDRPTTYYGLLARSFIASIQPSHVVSPVAATPYPGLLRLGRLVDDRAFTSGLEFWRLGEAKETREEMLSVNYKVLREDGTRGQESILVVAEMMQRLGDNRTAHAIARRELLKIIREGTNPLGRRAAMVCYPLAFRSFVSNHATEAGFAPDFLQGLMREESALDPLAKSPVGALGLTQLMPATAREVAKSCGLRGFTLGSLSSPDVNIHLGSVYLGRMLKQFGHPGLAAAAYNAGPGAVNRWLSSAHGAFDEFVEQIPFLETRGYVKRVLRSYAAYAYLYEHQADKALRVSLRLPVTATALK